MAQVFQGRSVCVAEQKFQITPIKMIEQATKKQTNEEFLKISQMTIQDMNDIMCTKKKNLKLPLWKEEVQAFKKFCRFVRQIQSRQQLQEVSEIKKTVE